MNIVEVNVGDKVRDCDPRNINSIKDVVAVTEEYVTVKRGSKETRIKRARVHADANKKKGYFVMPRVI